MNQKLPTTKLAIAIAFVVATALVLVVLATIHRDSLSNKFLGEEPFKLIYQFLLIVVAGGAVSLLFSSYTKATEKENAAKKEERAIQRKFYNDFVQAYNDGKKIRRFLRARARKFCKDGSNENSVVIKTKEYDELMKELTILQLKCEFFCDEVSSNQSLFSATGEIKQLSENLEKIEEYLNKLVGEYENCYSSFPNQYFIEDVPEIQLEKLEKLREFISKYREATCFKHQFKKAADEVTRILLNILIYPDTK